MNLSKVIDKAVEDIHSSEEKKQFASKKLIPLKNGAIDFPCSEVPEKNLVFPVEKLSAIDAIKKYNNNCDALLVSWPYMDNDLIQAIDEIL